MSSFRTWDNVAYPYVSPEGTSFNAALPARTPKQFADTSSPAYQNFAQSFRQRFNHKRGLNEAWLTMSDEERRAWATPANSTRRGSYYRPHVYDSSQKSATPPPGGAAYYRNKQKHDLQQRSMTPSHHPASMPPPTQFSWRITTEANYAPQQSSSSEVSPQEEAADALPGAYPVPADAAFALVPAYPSTNDGYVDAHHQRGTVDQFAAYAATNAPPGRPAAYAQHAPAQPAMHAPVPVRPAPAHVQYAQQPAAPYADWPRYAAAPTGHMSQQPVPLGYDQAGFSATYHAPAADVGWQYQAYPSAGSGYC
ncbi:hypothetical protein AURDEDRAFT_175355 [Auricularia subglabra TFB-10046 SS5]|uniref:Uncharacterized protein n=1 Tax=Auricularia subglabra (strain TFB-10046 / SS5) TaxID=717982 RepID=J0WTE4_AURST|nr:hypothetical protein AURDEDRAFT_175355 [Auricularia subglabra TFB-10046 SS5]